MGSAVFATLQQTGKRGGMGEKRNRMDDLREDDSVWLYLHMKFPRQFGKTELNTQNSKECKQPEEETTKLNTGSEKRLPRRNH